MTERKKRLLQYIVSKKHHVFRHKTDWKPAGEFAAAGLEPAERMCRRFERLCREEKPVLLPDEDICFLRTVSELPEIFTEAEWADIKKKHFVHELGFLSNLAPDYSAILANGLSAVYSSCDAHSRRCIDALLELTERYRKAALDKGDTALAETLAQVPKYGARNLREALQSFRILHFALWLEGNYHNNIGCFDRFMYPYFKKDYDARVYTPEALTDLVEDFFLSFNKDSDLYVGVQQGDNGQSMMLGGVDENGVCVFNELSRLCLTASRENMLIDPKINLRVDKSTPFDVFVSGSELTRAGLGFPQYSNDDVVIPALEKLGYSHADACGYAVAACWEFIVPGKGADICNIGAMSYPKAVDKALRERFLQADSFDDFYSAVKENIRTQCDEICAKIKNVWFVPSPFMNVLYGRDISAGGVYNNFGIHGTGIATAADSLAAMKKYAYDEKIISRADYLEAVVTNFASHAEILPLLRFEAPKMGQNNDAADSFGKELLHEFSSALSGRKNDRGGIYRAGTGSAMYYLWHAADIGASPDGRRSGEPFGTNFSCSLFARIGGPLSVIQSFTKPDFGEAINGGPLTLEFSSSTFDSEGSLEKLAQLIQVFIARGGHQLQLNAVNAAMLKDAQLHPENHRQLVVRIWGWSAYFVELDREYQNHVIARQEYAL